eukprot:362351-Chlamydomonas_euryale.AAC.1
MARRCTAVRRLNAEPLALYRRPARCIVQGVPPQRRRGAARRHAVVDAGGWPWAVAGHTCHRADGACGCRRAAHGVGAAAPAAGTWRAARGCGGRP